MKSKTEKNKKGKPAKPNKAKNTPKKQSKASTSKSNKKPVAKKPATGKKKRSSAGKTATGGKSSSGRTSQSAKRTKKTPAKQEQSKPKQQPKEQRVLVHGVVAVDENGTSVFPNKFPFWARLKISKNRTTLVIDEEKEVYNKQRKRNEEGFVHREAIHPKADGSNVKGYEKIEPNPDPTDDKDMYLKNPTKLPKRLFKPHNKKLNMPEHVRERYDKNNKKEQ